MMQCPACGADGARDFATAWDGECFTTGAERFLYRCCGACETVFLDPPPVDRLGQIYPDDYYSYDGGSGGIVQRVKEALDVRQFRRVLDRLPADELAVLDVGGGSGWMLDILRRASDRVVATHEVDINERARAAAEASGHVFHCQPVEAFRADRPFQLILLLNLIEHVADPAAVLRAMRDALDPGGLLLVKTPNTDSWDRRLFQHHNWGGFHCPRHFVLFTLPGFLGLAKRCGLELVEATYTQGGPQWSSSVIQSLTRLGVLETSAERPVYFHPLFLPLAGLFAAFDFARRPFAPTAQMFVTLRRVDTR